MASPFSNLQSKLERAICAYLVSNNCGLVTDILPFESGQDRAYPNTTVEGGIARPEVLNTGIYRIPVSISVRGKNEIDPNNPDPNTPRVQFDQRVALTGDALVQRYANPADGHTDTLQATADDITAAGRALATSADPVIAADNADMGDFTIQGWFETGFGKGKADDTGCAWERVFLFDAVCCAAAIS